MRNRKLLKTMVLGAFACGLSLSTGVAAQAVATEPGQESTASQQAARHDMVETNWLDRTDITVGRQAKEGNQVSVETLQPLTSYDENTKSVLFIQAGLGHEGLRKESTDLHGQRAMLDPVTHRGFVNYTPEHSSSSKSLGTVANIGLGYRHLSKGEHAYVGINTFYDYAFSGSYKRISGGLEYVVGLNEFHFNAYKGLGGHNEHMGLVPLGSTYYNDYLHFDPQDWSSDSVLNYGFRQTNKALGGYDFSYARSFKNARWARAYADVYKWRSGHSASQFTAFVGSQDWTYKFQGGEKRHGWNLGLGLQLTPQLSVDLGYKHDSQNLSGTYGFVKYTLGKSKFAWHGGKHSDDTITNARARMLDKVERNSMQAESSYEEDWFAQPVGHL